MSQYYSRICIKVSSPEVWRRFEDEDDAGFDLAELADTRHTKYVIDEACWVEGEIDGIVEALAETLGDEGIIIADTTNINVDPYNYCVYYLGECVETEEFSIYRHESKCEMFSETNISDIAGWLSYGGFRVSESEKEQLFRCGISCSGKSFTEFNTELFLPNKIYLRETSFEGRAERIERCVLDEELYLVHASSKFDDSRLEVMGELGSLGYLPSEVSDSIAPFFLNNRLKYSAKIVDLVRLSVRNKHAKSAIVGIQIEAEICKDEVEVKKSVPSIDRDSIIEAEKRKAEEERIRREEELRRKEEEARRKEKEKQLNKSLEELEAELMPLKESLASVDAEIKLVNEELNSAVASQKSLSEKKNSLEETISATRVELKDVQTKLEEKKTDIDALAQIEASLPDKENELKILESSAAGIKQRKQGTTLDVRTKEISSLEIQIADLNKKLETMISEFNAAIEKENAKIKSSEVSIEIHSKAVEQKKAERTGLFADEQMKKAQAEKAFLFGKKKKQQEYEEAKLKTANKDREIEKEEAEIQENQRIISNVKKDIVSLSESNEANVKKLQIEIDTLSEEADRVKALLDEELQVDLAEVMTKLNKLNEDVQKDRETMQAISLVVDPLNKNISILKDGIESRESELSEVEKEIAGIVESIDKCNSKLEKLNNQRTSIAEKKVDAEGKIRALKVELQNL